MPPLIVSNVAAHMLKMFEQFIPQYRHGDSKEVHAAQRFRFAQAGISVARYKRVLYQADSCIWYSWALFFTDVVSP